MAAAPRKYITISAREAREALPPELQDALLKIVQTLASARQVKSPNKLQPHYFTLNMADKYALAAVEAYMSAVDADEANNGNPGVQEAREVALAAKDFAIMKVSGEKLPG